jgi:hypothetical protein
MPCNQQPDTHSLSDPTTRDYHNLSDPLTLKTPPGDYETRNFSREDFIEMNTLQMLLMLIAIFLFVSFKQALDSQCNNEDIFQNDVGRSGTNQLHLLERYLDVLVKHTTEIPPPTALVEGTAPSALVEGVSLS